MFGLFSLLLYVTKGDVFWKLNLNANIFVRYLYENNLVVKSGCNIKKYICKISA